MSTLPMNQEYLTQHYDYALRGDWGWGTKMTARLSELFAEHRCRPWLTMVIPPLTQLPVFVGSSMFLARLSQPPNSAFDSEAFLTLTSLAHPDPTAVLPIALGMITLANVESSRWFISAAVREREDAEQERIAEQRAQGQNVLEPRKIVQSGLRLLSIGRILIGAVVPGVRARAASHRYFWIFFLLFVCLCVKQNKQYLIGSFFRCAVFLFIYVSFAERGALLGLVGDFRSLADLVVRLLG